MIQNDKKKCNGCQEIFDKSFFNLKKGAKDGLVGKCKKCFRKHRKEYYQKNITKMRKEKAEYYKEHKEEKRQYDFKYRRLNKDKIKEHKRKWEVRNKDNPIFKIKRNLRRRIHHVLKGNRKSDKTFNLIGCSAEFFKQYIESLWKEGMSWENYSPKGWHVDHIIPCYKFNLLLEKEQLKCFHYTNQRPLWAWENLSRKKD